jgi:Mn-dependent DtxR family transcriptional regulator
LLSDRAQRDRTEFNISVRKDKQKPLKQIISELKVNDSNVRQLESEMEQEGMVGLTETDVYIMKNVLQTLPKEYFKQ